MVQIIGAGFGRTGTASQKKALELLGFEPCYHMIDVMRKGKDTAARWAEALNGRSELLPGLLEGYRATVDFPGCFVWRQLMDLYPDAKVVLSVRDPQAWYRSASATILSPALAEARAQSGAGSEFAVLADALKPHGFAPGMGQDDAIRFFEEHNAAVQREVPADRLLVYQVSQGWAPLCEFLGVPQPGVDFPRVNDSETFQRTVARAKETGVFDIDFA